MVEERLPHHLYGRLSEFLNLSKQLLFFFFFLLFFFFVFFFFFVLFIRWRGGSRFVHRLVAS